jgi:hypothetical protein
MVDAVLNSAFSTFVDKTIVTSSSKKIKKKLATDSSLFAYPILDFNDLNINKRQALYLLYFFVIGQKK